MPQSLNEAPVPEKNNEGSGDGAMILGKTWWSRNEITDQEAWKAA